MRRCLLVIALALACAPAPSAVAATVSFTATAPAPASAHAAHRRAAQGSAFGDTAARAIGASGSIAGSTAGLTSTGPGAAAEAAAATSETPVPVVLSSRPLAARRLSSERVLQIAERLPEMRALRHEYRGSFGGVYLKGSFRWQVSFFSRNGKKEIGQVTIDDLSGQVLEKWTGFQVAWTMARGYPGAFGRHVNALYVWLPLCLLFVLPFVNPRRLRSMLHLDLLVLLSFSVSLAFFDHAHIYASVPLAYPPLLYLLGRMLWLLRRRARGASPGPLRLLVPVPVLAIGVVFLLGFRIALNVTDGNVIDVGYAGVIGAQRIADGRPLYGSYPKDNEHGDTYGPANYEAYVPFEQAFGWSGRWDDLPAAHAAALFFDVLALGLLFLLGRRLRGPTLGIVLAYAWVSYPFTLYALESDANDTLVAALVLAAMLAASYRPVLARGASGGLAALAGLTKFAPLALAPILATHGLRERRVEGANPLWAARALAAFAAGFILFAAIASIPALAHDTLHAIYERTFVYQANRGSPFSVWGLYGGLGGVQAAVQVGAVVLALALAVLPRRDDLVGLAAACGAVLIAIQLGIDHWFYLYIPWFLPLVLLALLGRFSDPADRYADAASEPARSSRPAFAVST
jgi:hypothetical protein